MQDETIFGPRFCVICLNLRLADKNISPNILFKVSTAKWYMHKCSLSFFFNNLFIIFYYCVRNSGQDYNRQLQICTAMHYMF